MLHALLLPFWLGQVLTQEKSFERNPILSSPRLNEHGLHTARVAAAARLAAARRRRLGRTLSSEDRNCLDENGFIVKRDFLPPGVFSELVSQAKRLRASAREMIEGDTITRRVALDADVLARIPAARHLLHSREYRDLVGYAWSSAAAPMVYIQTILSQAIDGPPDPQTFLHADTFHPTVKAWFYLNDAAAESMPFIYVPGSHKVSRERLEWERAMSLLAPHSANAEDRQGSFRVNPSDLKALGLPAPRAVDAPGNTLIVADTFGFHARARSPQPMARVEIWAFGRRNPFLPWAGLDPWSFNGLSLRKPRMDWRMLDLLEACGMVHQRWRFCGEVSMFDSPLEARQQSQESRPRENRPL